MKWAEYTNYNVSRELSTRSSCDFETICGNFFAIYFTVSDCFCTSQVNAEYDGKGRMIEYNDDGGDGDGVSNDVGIELRQLR